MTRQVETDDLPLLQRFPSLRAIPRARLCTLPSPVQKLVDISPGGDLWIKRDDLNSSTCGGNKVRSLEFLLGGLQPGDTVVTVGGAGSTHVLSTAVHANRLGVTTIALRWFHDMNPAADSASDRIRQLMPESRIHRSTAVALALARYRSITGRARYIPLGGAIPLGVLGHVNAALELASQIEGGEMPLPGQIVLPVGSGGTVAGLLLGFAIAGLPVTVVGARVGPRMFVNRRRVLALVQRTASFIERRTGERLPRIDQSRLRIVHDVYGGGYGRPLDRSRAAAELLHAATGITLDDTYSAKAWVAALAECRSTTEAVVFWLTFDSTCLTN